MKKIIALTISLCLTSPIQSSQSYKLTHSMLKTIDSAGFFDRAIIDIITIRQKIKNFLHGKHLWSGVKCTLATTSSVSLETVLRRTETIYGATFIVISPTDKNLFKFVTNNQKEAITKYVNSIQKLSLHQRQEHVSFEGYFTGSYAIHPLSKKKLPIYVSDYTSELFDTRNNYAHLAIPAHNTKDFEFAQKHHLDIQLVVNAIPGVPAHEHPQFSRDGKHLTHAYTKDDLDEIVIINSDDLNGTPKVAIEKTISFLQESKTGSTYSTPIMYEFCGKKYSLEHLKTIEEALYKEHLSLSSQQQEVFGVLMNYTQSDLLDIVEPCLQSINAAKDLMIELIEQSCQLRQTKNSYMLKWSQLKSSESERVIFKRDIVTFQELAKFCSDLVNFLGDFASSCPHALEHLKRLKNA